MSDATSTVSITEDSPKTSGGSAMSTITMTGANDEPTSTSQPEDGSSSTTEKSDAQHQLSLELMWQQPASSGAEGSETSTRVPATDTTSGEGTNEGTASPESLGEGSLMETAGTTSPRAAGSETSATNEPETETTNGGRTDEGTASTDMSRESSTLESTVGNTKTLSTVEPETSNTE
jgi:hypothetical protein